ncbi:MAG: YraN family protein [Flavobacteriaceae bacterium]|nr:YraN family protein [Flavobacteriaceae bacterium]
MNQVLGQQGEQLASEHLKKKGYTIKHTNWRYKHKEIDIIAETDEYLVFVEVKSRSTDFYQNPQDAVTKTKQRFIIDAAEAYIIENDIEKESRFDIIAITKQGNKYKIEHIPDAYNSLI